MSIVLMLMGAGCSEDIPESGSTPGGYTSLVVSVDVAAPYSGVQAQQTRSGFDNFDNENDKWGVDGENIESIRIIILDSSGYVEHNRVFTTEGNVIKAGEYEFLVKNNETKTIILVANEGHYYLDSPGMEIPGGTEAANIYFRSLAVNEKVNVEDLMKLTVSLQHNSPDGKGLSLKTPLPITAIYSEEIPADTYEIRREYDLHRAAVKYSFRILNESGYHHELDAVRIDRIADREYLFPNADWEENEFGHLAISGYRTPIHAVEQNYYHQLSTPLSLPAKMTDAVEAMPSFYVPEGLQNIAAQRVSIALDGQDLFDWKDLKWRMPGESDATSRPMVDLPRNSHVIVNIVIKEENKISLIADVQPYASVSLDPYFGFDRDENDNIILEKRPDGTFIVLIKNEEVMVDANGDKILKKFLDGTILCQEVVYKDYIHDSSEVDYTFTFEKDSPGGNVVIVREKSGGRFHAEEGMEDPDHEHDPDDRPSFVFSSDGNYYRCVYDTDGNRTLSRFDVNNREIIQVNGYQYRSENNSDPMYKFLGTYLAKDSAGNINLYNCSDGSLSTLNWKQQSIRKRMRNQF